MWRVDADTLESLALGAGILGTGGGGNPYVAKVWAGCALAGGAVFDYASGRIRRGPRLLTESGFEWLARLLCEPRRLWRRYLLGNPLFLSRVLRQLFLGPPSEGGGP